MIKYVIVSPVRNEEKYIEETILSVLNQTILPAEYILVNDGSTDSTRTIIEKYSSEHTWIKVVDRPPKEHSPGRGVVEAFYEGFNVITETDWDFIVKLDGDLKFNETYFEEIFHYFQEDPKLGMASGTEFIYKRGKIKMVVMPEDHVKGASKVIRKECWDEIGGFERVLGWDTIDEERAQVLGWKTRSYKEIKMIHFKPVGVRQKNIVKREILAGERQHYLGYLPAFAIFKGFYRMFRKPFLIAGVLNIYGFAVASLSRGPQVEDKAIVNNLRNKQRNRLLFKRKLLN
jgi:glycosyltransferase involved in cell wall biosynthesis